MLGPGEAAHDARAAAATAQADAIAAFAWPDEIVSNYAAAEQRRWLTSHRIERLRGSGGLAGLGAVERAGVRRTRPSTS